MRGVTLKIYKLGLENLISMRVKKKEILYETTTKVERKVKILSDLLFTR